MLIEENKALVRRYYEEMFGGGNLALAEELIASNYLNHGTDAPPGGWPRGVEGARAIVGTYRGAFPDLRFVIEDQVAEGDKVVTRWMSGGTHRGPLAGIPATGRAGEIMGITIERIEGGKIAETWINFDQLGLLQQIGVIPTPGQ